ncbi:MAG: GxxExxY protein [Bacteroidota bacterium]
MNENELSYKIIGVAFKLHSQLGPGLLESAYESAFAFDLLNEGLEVRRQYPISFIYKGIKLESAYRVDLMIDDKVLIEMKSVEALAPVHYAQTLTYLRLADKRLALLINFNEKSLKSGIHRIVNNL